MFLKAKSKIRDLANSKNFPKLFTLFLFITLLIIVVFARRGGPVQGSVPVTSTASLTPTIAPTTSLTPASPYSAPGGPAQETPVPGVSKTGSSRGYLTTPQELIDIATKADQGVEPYQSSVNEVLQWADKEWRYTLHAHEDCSTSNSPAWNDNGNGTPILYAKALAYHLTGDVRYAEEVKSILESIMTQVQSIDIENQRCRLVFGWGTPELVASADLIEDYWWNKTCTGPTGTKYGDSQTGSGNCKELFQNWLVKNPYYVVSFSAESSKSNWGAAATNTLAYISDYLWDRPDMLLIHRNPPQINGGKDVTFTPAEAFKHANKLALDRMNGYGVELGSTESCDYLSGIQQNLQWEPVKSQISEKGIIPEDARRQEYCNIPNYNGEYQNYPQIHLGNNIQQCELMLRRGDPSCYDNVDNKDLPNYKFNGPDGVARTTHLYPGRGSIERGINAIIVDSKTEWRHGSALEVAFRYYYVHHTLPGFEQWQAQLADTAENCSQDICFGVLTHGFAIGLETPVPPPTVPPP